MQGLPKTEACLEQRLRDHSTPLKIVHLIPEDSLGGAETAAREMACRDDLACDLKLLSMAGELLVEGRPRFSGLGFRSPLNPFAQLAAVRAILALNPDVVVSSLWKSAPAALMVKLLRPRMKLVAFFHSAERTHGMDRVMHSLLMWHADALWADSSVTLAAAGTVRSGLPTRIISTVIDRAPPSPPARKPQARFVSWSRIHRHKGMDRSIDLIAKLVALGVDARFDIWGPDQGPRAALEEQATRLGIADRIRFHGAVSRTRLPEIASDAAFLLQLSLVEGMAMVVVEAMQLGLVPVVTPVGEIQRYCRDGDNALLVDPGALDEAAGRIAALLSDPAGYQRMAVAAHRTWQDRRTYSEDFCAAAHEVAGRAK